MSIFSWRYCLKITRIASGHYIMDVDTAKKLLSDFVAGPNIKQIPDNQFVKDLPAWVKTGKQVSDGHLLSIAHANRARLVTLDEGIPGAYLLP